jgi:signal transduction histidine kinase
MVSEQIKQSKITFEIKTSEFEATDLGYFVKTDRNRLLQILINLSTNAIKFTPAEGTVSVTVELAKDPTDESDGELSFTVRDTGMGIPEE